VPPSQSVLRFVCLLFAVREPPYRIENDDDRPSPGSLLNFFSQQSTASTQEDLLTAPHSDDDDESVPPPAIPGPAQTAGISTENAEIFDQPTPPALSTQPPAPEATENTTIPATATNNAAPGMPTTAPPPPPAAAEFDSTAADLPAYEITAADLLLDSVFGDHVHANDGTQLSGDVPEDPLWQRRWRKLVAYSPQRYEVPKGRIGQRFLSMLAAEFDGIIARKWNSERPLVFVAVVLQTQAGVSRAQDIRARIESRLNIWEEGRIVALLNDTIVQLRSQPSAGGARRDQESEARSFNAKVLSGRLCSAVRTLTHRSGGGVMMPDDLCTKTGRPVAEVMQDKHPAGRDPGQEIGRSDTAFEPYEEGPPDSVPVEVTAEIVESVASKLSGGAGPGGTDAVTLQNWLLRYGVASERLRISLASLGAWLANGNPPWAAYRALRACRLVALDKQPGSRPVGIGEIYSRLFAKCVLQLVGLEATHACGSLNLCVGLKSGIEGAVHAVQSLWDEHQPTKGPTAGGIKNAASAPAREGIGQNEEAGPRTSSTDGNGDGVMDSELGDGGSNVGDGETAADDEDDDPWGGLLVDACNGFNELQRKAMLWTVRHLWPAGARMAFNAYRHSAILVMRGRDGRCEFLLSREGVTQGDPLSMLLYGLALVPLARNIRDAVPEAVQPWYADDGAMAAKASKIGQAFRMLQVQGPRRGYFPEAEKSIVLCTKANEGALRRALQDFNFRYAEGHRYIGGFIGTEELRKEWIFDKVVEWVYGVQQLAMVARKFPQAAYAGLTKSLQSEWTYLQRVVPDLEQHFEAVERAIMEDFLPALFGEVDSSALKPLRELFALPCRFAGLGIPLPGKQADSNYEDSKKVTRLITQSLLTSADLAVGTYLAEASKVSGSNRTKRAETAEKALESHLASVDRATQRRITRSKECGAWLTAMPLRLNGTELSALEFRDALRMRFGLKPSNLPDRCDGCGDPFSVDHAMSCRKGGLVTHRHDDVAGEWHQLCASALSPTKVTDKPIIPQSQTRVEVQGQPPRMVDPPQKRGDVAAHSFWTRGMTTIFDIRITDTDARLFRNKDPSKVLGQQAKAKKDKYLETCLQSRRHFTPLVFSMDGLREKETVAAGKRLSRLLAEKWKRPYSQVVGMVRSRLSIALVRASSRCLRESRAPSNHTHAIQWIEGAGLRLFR